MTDIHFGRKGNDQQALRDNEEFIGWFIDEARSWGADDCICLGDWHDQRHSLHVNTLNSSLWCMERLAKAFKRVFLLVGNHDLYYREKRDLYSVAFFRNLKNVHIINQPVSEDEVTLLPWLVGDEWKALRDLKSRYLFGHLELPGYLMNGKLAMADHGGVNDKHFADQEFVFSGHFHLRQARHNVVYIGNVFPFNFSDDWDEERGCMLLEWGNEPQFRTWPEQPLYRTMTLSQLVNDPDKYLREKVTARVTIDDPHLTFEEAVYLRDTLCTQFGARKIDLIHQHTDDETEIASDVEFRSVDQLVLEGLHAVQSVGMQPEMLIDIYKSLA